MAAKRCWGVFHLNKQVGVGPDMYILPKDGTITSLYYSEEDAIRIARKVASHNPGTSVIVLEAKTIFEAKKPETFSKAWKSNGELIPIELKKPERNEEAMYDDPELEDAIRPAQAPKFFAEAILNDMQVQGHQPNAPAGELRVRLDGERPIPPRRNR